MFLFDAPAQSGLTVAGHVPGGIYTDLERADILQDGPLLYRFNDGNYRWIAFNDWNYALDFDGMISP